VRTPTEWYSAPMSQFETASSFVEIRDGKDHRSGPRQSPLTVVGSVIFLLFTTTDCVTKPMEPACVLAPSEMPESWQPSGQIQQGLNTAPWSVRESEDAQSAVRAGFNELQQFFSNRPGAVSALGSDAVEAVIDASYAASNMPTLQAAASDLARRNLTQLMAPYLARGSVTAACREYSPLLALTMHARALLPADDSQTSTMVALTNAAYHMCGSLTAAIGYDYRQKLAISNPTIDDIWDLAMWSITFTDAELVPNLDIPIDARDLPPALWRFLEHYPFVAARAYREGARNTTFYDTAYLATHIAYIPTGYDRYPIYIEDAPWLYQFLRENFYAVLSMGELDMVAEFTDLFRQYGCTEQNDLQLRDGTRYLLKLFHSAGDRWMSHREPNEPANTGDYNEVHKAWTGMAAVRVRVPETASPGTYGGVIRQWLGYPR
jgi:hypothetical protein